MTGEIWKSVIGYEGLYEASNLGRIRNAEGLILKPSKRPDGYPSLNLTRDKKKIKHYVHVLILTAFYGRPDGLQANHIDGNKENSRLDNLEWVTRRENSLHAIITGLDKKRRISKENLAAVRKMLASGRDKKQIASELGLSEYTVKGIHSGKSYSFM